MRNQSPIETDEQQKYQRGYFPRRGDFFMSSGDGIHRDAARECVEKNILRQPKGLVSSGEHDKNRVQTGKFRTLATLLVMVFRFSWSDDCRR